MRRPCLAVLLVLLLPVAHEHALACWCSDGIDWSNPAKARKFLIKEFGEATAVFSGEVVMLDTFKLKIKVDRFWKGASTEEVTMSTGAKKLPRNGRSKEDLISISTCDYKFEIG